ncbi:MAG TPA: hypothetical protein VIE38_03240 [Gaiellaceae bacterium]
MPPELVFAAELFFPPEALWTCGAARRLATCALGVLPLLVGVGVDGALTGGPVPELLAEGDV